MIGMIGECKCKLPLAHAARVELGDQRSHMHKEDQLTGKRLFNHFPKYTNSMPTSHNGKGQEREFKL